MSHRNTSPRAKRRAQQDQSSPRVMRRTIQSWAEFVGIVQSWQGFRNWCFRGQASADWSLKSSLSRHIEVSKVSERAWSLQESRIRRIFRRKSHLFIDDLPADDELEWLALMQHHGRTDAAPGFSRGRRTSPRSSRSNVQPVTRRFGHSICRCSGRFTTGEELAVFG